MKEVELARIREVVEEGNSLVIDFDNGITLEFRNDGGRVVPSKRGQ